MARRRKNPTSQQIMDAYNTAINPKSSAEDKQKAEAWLRSENAKMTKAANERIAEMRRKGLIDANDSGTAAYNILKQDVRELNYDKLIYRKGMSFYELRENMLAARKFLESQTSSAAGEKRRRERIYKQLVKGNYIKVTGDAQKDASNKQAFFDFLDSKVFEDIKQFNNGTNLPDGESLLGQAYEAISQGKSVKDLMDMYNDYINRTRDIDIFDIWDNWTKGTKLPDEQ